MVSLGAKVDGDALDSTVVAPADAGTVLAVENDLRYVEMSVLRGRGVLADETSKSLFGLRRRLTADQRRPDDSTLPQGP